MVTWPLSCLVSMALQLSPSFTVSVSGCAAQLGADAISTRKTQTGKQFRLASLTPHWNIRRVLQRSFMGYWTVRLTVLDSTVAPEVPVTVTV